MVVNRLLFAICGVHTRPDFGEIRRELRTVFQLLRKDAIFLGGALVALVSIGGYTIYSVSLSPCIVQPNLM